MLMLMSRLISVASAGYAGLRETVRPNIAEVATRLARAITGGRPNLLLVPANLATLSLAWFLAYLIRYEFTVPGDVAANWALTLPFVLAVHCVSFYANGVFRILWPYVGIRDAMVILRGTACAVAALYVLNWLVVPPGIVPRSVILLDGILTHGGVCGLFLLLRLVRESRLRTQQGRRPRVPVLIVGAGDSGDALLREIERAKPFSVQVVGFIDDDPDKKSGLLRGVPVLGGVDQTLDIAREHSIKQVLVALPGSGGEVLRRVVRPLLKAGLTVKVLPSLNNLSTTAPLVLQLKDVAIEDLLRRDPIRLEEGRIAAILRGKRVLVTGAAGSIGSELCRQILRYRPARLVTYDWAETPLHDLMLELKTGLNEKTVFPELGDVTDAVRIRGVFEEHAPDVVFHAAALKHVPVCEDHPREAVRVNVGGTRTVAEQAVRSAAGLFILISTDKAVNPSSVMGATKRAAEFVIQELNAEAGPTRFAAVRFGNVLGSNGSVLNIFKSQLARGGPLTVTHPEMRRYFMTIPEAVELVLQAAVLGRGGEVFELDMGSPVRIVDLAEDFVRLSGLTPGRDVRIKFTGVRPGEKLFEELYCNSETVVPTSHPKVFCLKSVEPAGGDPAIQLCHDRLGPVDPANDPVLARIQGDFQAMLTLPRAEGASVP